MSCRDLTVGTYVVWPDLSRAGGNIRDDRSPILFLGSDKLVGLKKTPVHHRQTDRRHQNRLSKFLIGERRLLSARLISSCLSPTSQSSYTRQARSVDLQVSPFLVTTQQALYLNFRWVIVGQRTERTSEADRVGGQVEVTFQ